MGEGLYCLRGTWTKHHVQYMSNLIVMNLLQESEMSFHRELFKHEHIQVALKKNPWGFADTYLRAGRIRMINMHNSTYSSPEIPHIASGCGLVLFDCHVSCWCHHTFKLICDIRRPAWSRSKHTSIHACNGTISLKVINWENEQQEEEGFSSTTPHNHFPASPSRTYLEPHLVKKTS